MISQYYDALVKEIQQKIKDYKIGFIITHFQLLYFNNNKWCILTKN